MAETLLWYHPTSGPFRRPESRRNPGLFWPTLAHGGYHPVTDMSPSQKRRAIRRRKASVEGALRYLREGLAGLPGVRKGTAEKRIRESSQPTTTARALVKGWRGRKRASAATPPVDDRAAFIRVAYAMELGHGWPAGYHAGSQRNDS